MDSTIDISVRKFIWFTREPRKNIRICQSQFEHCRFLRLASALFGAVAIIPIIVDYELGYSELRTRDTCKINSEHSYLLRSLSVIFSLTAIVLSIFCHYYYFRWVNTRLWTFAELPPASKFTHLDAMDMMRKRTPISYLTETYLPGIVILFLITPYPGINIEIYLTQQVLYQQVTICYYLEEIFFFIMFARLIYLILAGFGYGRFQTSMARRICELERVDMGPEFSLKCYVSLHPVYVLLFFFLIPGIVIFGAGLRLFERPVHMPNMDMGSLSKTMWCLVVTITTVGYGDTIVTSNLGRIVILMGIFWGGIVLSMTFVALGGLLKLKSNEEDAFRAISVARASASVIEEKFCEKMDKMDMINRWRSAYYKIRAYIHVSRNTVLTENQVFRNGLLIESQVDRVERKASEIEMKLERYLKKFE